MQPIKTWLVCVCVFKRGIRKWEIAPASFFLFISKVIPRILRTQVLRPSIVTSLPAGGWCWGLLEGWVGREHPRGCGSVQSTFTNYWLCAEHDATVETERKKHKTEVLRFWRHLEQKRNCFLFQQNGNWEAGTKFNICQHNRILYIKTLWCFLLIPQEIRRCGWGEGKGSWGAEMSWLEASLSPAITTKLVSAKIQIRKLGGGIPGSSLYCGRPLSRRDTPPLLFYLFYGKR